jgi:predicted acyltransferase
MTRLIIPTMLFVISIALAWRDYRATEFVSHRWVHPKLSRRRKVRIVFGNLLFGFALAFIWVVEETASFKLLMTLTNVILFVGLLRRTEFYQARPKEVLLNGSPAKPGT